MDQESINQQFSIIASSERLLPIKVTKYYQGLIDEEVGILGHGGPLHRTAYPSEERLTVRAPGEHLDFVQDRINMPNEAIGAIVQKYSSRIIFLPTERCAGHCQYCFRQDYLTSGDAGDVLLGERVMLLKRFLSTNPGVNEVILSGGDPLMLPMDALREILRVIAFHGMHARIHTRMIIFSPRVIRPDLLELLAQYRVRVVIHVVHPYELADEVRSSIERLNKAGVRLYSQFPILRKVNDSSAVLARLLTDLDDLRVRNLSIFIADPISYSASFRLPLRRVFEIYDDLCLSQPAWVSSTRLIMDTPYGKVGRDDILSGPDENGVVIFLRSGNHVAYHDFPTSLDIPGEPAELLWKG
jgi:KamA family protein